MQTKTIVPNTLTSSGPTGEVPRTLDKIVEKNVEIENKLADALSLLHAMETRLTGLREDSPKEGENPTETSHLPVLQQQQGKMESLTNQILSVINVLQTHI